MEVLLTGEKAEGQPKPKMIEVIVAVGAHNASAMIQILEQMVHEQLPDADITFTLSCEEDRRGGIGIIAGGEVFRHMPPIPWPEIKPRIMISDDMYSISRKLALMFAEVPLIDHFAQLYRLQKASDDGVSRQVSQYLPPNHRNMRTLRRDSQNYRGKKSKGR